MSSLSNLVFQAMVGLSVTGSFIVTGVEISPPPSPMTSDYFEVHKFDAVRAGNTAFIEYDRTIHSKITLAYTVRIMGKGDNGWQQFCKYTSLPFEYQPDATLPEDIDLSWWTDGRCPTLPEGAARIITTWSPQEFGLKPVTRTAEVP